ncbi:hypothetical protein M8J77_010753 [Diaphorina citri]|nr:hypothetical protein M8J77_010753 [Diaphorina citri]
MWSFGHLSRPYTTLSEYVVIRSPIQTYTTLSEYVVIRSPIQTYTTLSEYVVIRSPIQTYTTLSEYVVIRSPIQTYTTLSEYVVIRSPIQTYTTLSEYVVIRSPIQTYTTLSEYVVIRSPIQTYTTLSEYVVIRSPIQTYTTLSEYVVIRSPIQTYTTLISEAQKLGLRVNEEKTEVMFINTPEENISINGKAIKTVQNFKYLGTVIQSNGQIDKDIQHRLNSASINFRNLYDRVWKPHELSLKTKLQIYETVVLSTLLYSSECWTTTTNHMNVLNAFHLRCLRTICRIKWTDRTPNEEVLKKTGMLSINNIIQKRRLRWAGHISRMDEGRTPHQVAFSELKKGKRQQQKPKKRWIDALKQDLKELQIDTANWRHIAANRDQWRKCINKKVETAQTQQLEKIEYDRRERHVARDQYSWKCPICNLTKESESGRQYIYKHIAEVHDQNSTPEPNTGTNPNLKCPSCNLECRSKAGLLSHLRNKHNNTGPESVKPIKVLTRTNTPAGSIVAVTTGTSPTTTQPLVTPVNELQCIACSRICKSKAGLRSHQRNVICMRILDTMETSDTMDS